MKPYYELGNDKKAVVVELIRVCQKYNLSCAGFQIYNTPLGDCSVDFFISRNKMNWRLIVKHQKKNRGVYFDCSDIYHITEDSGMKILYEYSVSDIA